MLTFILFVLALCYLLVDIPLTLLFYKAGTETE